MDSSLGLNISELGPCRSGRRYSALEGAWKVVNNQAF